MQNFTKLAFFAAALFFSSDSRAEYHLECWPGGTIDIIYVDPNGHLVRDHITQINCQWVDYISEPVFYGDVEEGESGSGGGIDVNPPPAPVTPVETKLPPAARCSAGQSGNAPKVVTSPGNPINMSNGEKVETETDFEVGGQVPLRLVRRYSSYNTAQGLFGVHWQSNFDYFLRVGTSNEVWVRNPSLGDMVFSPDVAVPNKWQSTASGVEATVTKLPDGSYTLSWQNYGVQRYNAAGQPISIKDVQGLGYDFTYDTNSKLTRVTATGGRFVQFVWTGNQLTKVIDPAGNEHEYVYFVDKLGPGRHLLQKVDYADTLYDTREYYYENATFPGALTGKKIGSGGQGGRFSWFTYDSAGRATSTEHRTGPSASTAVEKYTFSYSTPDANTLVVSETNPLGKQASYRFVAGQLESVTGLPSASCPASLFTRTKDANGFTDVVTDNNDNQTDLDFDTDGHTTKEVHGLGSINPTVVTYQWDDANNRLLSRTVQGDHSVSLAYDAAGRIASETVKNLSPYGVANQTRVISYAYQTHANGLLSSMTTDGPLPGTSDTLVQTFSTTGDLLTVADGFGVLLTYSNYNNLGLPGRVTDNNGVTIDFTYDIHGRQLSAKRTLGGVETFRRWEYNSRGLLSRVVAPDGGAEMFLYDNADRVTTRRSWESIIDYTPQPGEEATQSIEEKFNYDVMSNLTLLERSRRLYVKTTTSGFPKQTIYTVTTTDDMSTFRDYDELGRLKAQRGNHGQNVRYAYDPSGYVMAITDSLGRVTSFTRDAQNRVTKSTDARSGETRYAYDAGGRVSSVTDARGLVTSYQYDGFGQLWRLQSPDTGVTTFTYDAYGRRTSRTLADLSVTTFAYDSFGRVSQQQVGAMVQNFTYDACANGLRRLCGATDATGSTSFGYTPVGLLAQQVNVIAGTSYTTSYAYDSADRIASITYPDGKTAAYTYDDGRLRSISATPNGTSKVVANTLRYQPFGPLTSLNYGNGLLRSHDFDTDGRLTHIEVINGQTSAVVQGLDYAWSANDQITGIINARNSALSQTYSYDELGRLTGASRSAVAEAFAYDAVGNRTSHSKTGQATINFSYSATSNRLSSSQSRVWTHDGNGNGNGFTGADGVAVGLHYDAFGRIDSSSRNSISTTYGVNAFGQRVRKDGPSGSYRFVYAPDGTLLAELKVGHGWTNYVRANGEVLGLIRGSALKYVHSDHLTRPELVTDDAGSVVWSSNNYAFERQVSLDQIGGLNLGFPGQYFDVETSTWYNLLRDSYDSSIGRFIQSDPIGLADGTNTYAYVGSDPINAYDPLGLCQYPAIITELSGGQFFTGEIGALWVFDASNKQVELYGYLGAGPGLSATPIAGAFSYQAAVVDTDDLSNVEGYGWSVNGVLAAGYAGLSVGYAAPFWFQESDYRVYALGGATGGSAGAGFNFTRTWHLDTFKLDQLPNTVRKAIEATVKKTGIDCDCK